MPTPSFVDQAGRWFLNSGIQEPQGGVARYRRTDTGQNLPVSNEITGYAASALVYLFTLTGQSEYLDRAVAAARFLTRHAWDAERRIFPFEPAPPGTGLAYFFDSGIIVRGLLAVWRVTRAPEFLEIAQACGRAMTRHFAAEMPFHPVVRLADLQPLAYDHQWSRSPGCYQLKAAMAWFDLHEETGEREFYDHYHRFLEHTLATYGAFLPGDPDRHGVMDRLHAYCYFLEGLLPSAADRRCAAALCDGLRRVEGYLRAIGPSFERADVYAQLLRLRLYAQAAGVAPLDRAAASFDAGRLAGFQCPDTGGFYFGRKEGALLPFINPVSAAFGLQALALWHDYLAGGRPPQLRALI